MGQLRGRRENCLLKLDFFFLIYLCETLKKDTVSDSIFRG
jgi:hypothetical protein